MGPILLLGSTVDYSEWAQNVSADVLLIILDGLCIVHQNCTNVHVMLGRILPPRRGVTMLSSVSVMRDR